MENSRIYIGSDHAGFKLKEVLKDFLSKKGYDVKDVGPFSYNKDDDYPDYALAVCVKVAGSQNNGLLICGSGQGMDRVANKVKGIYASVCWNEKSAVIAKEHGNINVLCLGGLFVKPGLAKKIVNVWLERPFANEERHVRRIDKIMAVEKSYVKKR